MVRQHVHARTSFVGPASGSAGLGAEMRRTAAPRVRAILRLIVAPVALAAAAVAGLVFAVLLPICGIATIAEGIARAALRFVRDSVPHAPQPPVRRI